MSDIEGSFGLGDEHGRAPGQRCGPYGTNEGDTWLMGEYFQERVKAEKGPGWRMCISLLRNQDTGKLEERYYTTENPEMVKEADEGHELWVAEQASRN